MPLKDALKSIKAKLGSNSSNGSDTHPTGSPATASGAQTPKSGPGSPRVSGQHDRVDSRRTSLSKEQHGSTQTHPSSSTSRTKSPGPVDTFLGKAKSLKSSAPGSSLAQPKSTGASKGSKVGPSKHSEKVKRRKARKEQHRKEVAERMESEGLGGKKGRMAKRADPGSKYRNETFGYYPLMRSDPKQTESESTLSHDSSTCLRGWNRRADRD